MAVREAALFYRRVHTWLMYQEGVHKRLPIIQVIIYFNDMTKTSANESVQGSEAWIEKLRTEGAALLVRFLLSCQAHCAGEIKTSLEVFNMKQINV